MHCKRWQLFWLVFSNLGALRRFPARPGLWPDLPGLALPAPAAFLYPMHPTDSTDRTDQRLTALEIKASYSDDLLEQLNLLVYRQQLQIDALVQQLQQMHRQLPETGSGGAAPRNLRDELPPHY